LTETQELPIELEVEAGRVAVTATHASGVSTVVIERHGTAGTVRHVPIGTRDAAALTMHIDGEPVSLRPGRGRYMRGSYKVRVKHGTVTYLFRPKSPDSSRLFRDGVRLADFELRDGTIDVTWHAQTTPAAPDVAVGHALAAAFGTGAQFFIMLLLDLLGHVPD
jgi:hypothetical protein